MSSKSVEKNEAEYHKSRRMFAILGNKLKIASVGDERSHDEWFIDDGWIGSVEDPQYQAIVRGMVDPFGDVYFYVGDSLETNELVEKVFLNHLGELVKLLRLPEGANVGAGMIKGEKGTQWHPRKKLGLVRDLLSGK